MNRNRFSFYRHYFLILVAFMASLLVAGCGGGGGGGIVNPPSGGGGGGGGETPSPDKAGRLVVKFDSARVPLKVDAKLISDCNFSIYTVNSSGNKEKLFNSYEYEIEKGDSRVTADKVVCGKLLYLQGEFTGKETGTVRTFDGVSRIDSAGGTAYLDTSLFDETNARMTAIEVEPVDGKGVTGETLQFTASAVFGKKEVRDATNSVVWKSSNTKVLELGVNGLAELKTPGKVKVTAHHPDTGLEDTVEFTVISEPPVDLTITPAKVTLPAGTDQQFKATLIYASGYTKDVTSTAKWASESTKIAKVDAKGLMDALTPGKTNISATCEGLTAKASVTVTDAIPEKIEIEPSKCEVPKGLEEKLVAWMIYSDGSRRDITEKAKWDSSKTSIASVEQGLVKGLKEGKSTVTASSEGLSGECQVTVTPAVVVSITVTPDPLTLAKGLKAEMKAEGTFSDGTVKDVTSQVTWSSENRKIASVSNSKSTKGVLTARGVGKTTVTASIDDVVSNACAIEVTPAELVSVEVDPGTVSIAKGFVQQFTAYAIYTDNTKVDVTNLAGWTSGNTDAASISNDDNSKGLAQTLEEGDSVITAIYEGVEGTASLTVTRAVAVKIELEPTSLLLPMGNTSQLTATAIFSDNTSGDVTSQVTWNSSKISVASVTNTDPKGEVKAQATGEASITATLDGVTSSACQVKVTPAELVSLTITPANPEIAKGRSCQFVAMALYTDDTNLNVTSYAAWSSTEENVSVVSGGNASGKAVGTTVITATLDGMTSNEVTLTVKEAEPDLITVTPASTSVPMGETVSFTATLVYSDRTTDDITGEAVWASSAVSIATIDNAAETAGTARPVSAGDTNITASYAGLTSNAAKLTVTPAVLRSIQITPALTEAPKGVKVQYTAMGTYSDSTSCDITDTVVWSSSQEDIASISNAEGSKGQASLLAEGTAYIRAASDNVSAEQVKLTVTPAELVSITVTPAEPSAACGLSVQMTATGVYTDDTTEDLTEVASWTSTNNDVVTLNRTGLATGLYVGTEPVYVKASYQGVSGQTLFTVTPAIMTGVAITPVSPEVIVGLNQQFAAKAVFSDNTTQDITPDWSTSDNSVAAIDQNGLAQALQVGEVDIYAVSNGITGQTTLRIKAAQLTGIELIPASGAELPLGDTADFEVWGLYDNNTRENVTEYATWDTTDHSVAVAVKGHVETLAEGNASVTVSYTGFTASAPVTVTAKELRELVIDPESVDAPLGTVVDYTLTAVYSDASTLVVTDQAEWHTGDGNIAYAYDSPKGRIKSVATGDTTVTATYGGKSATAQINVIAPAVKELYITPEEATVPCGLTQQFSLYAVYTDETTHQITEGASWSVQGGSAVSIDNSGLATSHSAGSVVIAADYSGFTATARLNVREPEIVRLEVDPAQETIFTGASLRLTVTAVYDNNTTATVTNSASYAADNECVSVSTGNVQALSSGTANITVTYGGKSVVAIIVVKDASLVSITIDPPTLSIPAGLEQRFTATGLYDNGGTAVITNAVTWESTNTRAARIYAGGNLHAFAKGTTTIKATLGEVSAQAAVNVTEGELIRVELTPPVAEIPTGLTKELKLTGAYTDGFRDFTNDAAWSSDKEAVATVSSSGVVTGKSAGDATITAVYDGKEYTAVITVTNACLVRLDVQSEKSELVKSNRMQFSVTGIFSDDSTKVMTNDVVWSTSDEGIAIVSNASGAKGNVYGVETGEVDIIASYDTISGSKHIDVVDLKLVSIEVTPASYMAAVGTTVQYTAKGTYNNDNVSTLGNQVVWSVGNDSCSISNTAGKRGLLTVLNDDNSSCVVTATVGDVSGSAEVKIVNGDLTSLRIEPNALTIAPGESVPIAGIYATYSNMTEEVDVTKFVASLYSDNSEIATISNAEDTFGTVTGIAEGSAQLVARLDHQYAHCNVTVSNARLTEIQVTPSSVRVPKAGKVSFRATGIYDDDTTRDLTEFAVWNSSEEDVAVHTGYTYGGTVDLAADFTGLVNVTASKDGVTSNTAKLEVTDAAISSIEITPIPAVPAGAPAQLTAIIYYEDGKTADVTSWADWRIVSGTAEVTADGIVTIPAVGEAVIGVSYAGASSQLSVTATDAVIESVTVTPSAWELPIGMSYQFKATAIFSDGSTVDVTQAARWSSLSENTAIVSNSAGERGLVTTLASGTAKIKASYLNYYGVGDLTVTEKTITGLEISPSQLDLPLGNKRYFTATAVFDDNTTLNVTKSSVWTSSNTAAATVSNVTSTCGQVASVAKGSTAITAAYGNMTATAEVTVVDAALKYIKLTPRNSELFPGQTAQLTATGTYTDGHTADITQDVTYRSDKEAYATVSNAEGSKGVATAVKAGGFAEIYASLDGITTRKNNSETAYISVNTPTLQSLEISVPMKEVAVGKELQCCATGIYDSGQVVDLTSNCTWYSSDTDAASFNEGGKLYGKTLGSKVTIYATYRTTSGHITTTTSNNLSITVSNGNILQLQITPVTLMLPVGYTQSFNAYAVYEGGSMMEVTKDCVWSSSDECLTISNTEGSKGLVTAVSAGTSEVKAAYGEYESLAVLVTVTTRTQNHASMFIYQEGDIRPISSSGSYKVYFDDGAQNDVRIVSQFYYENGTYIDVTSDTFTYFDSSDPSIAEVSYAPETMGKITIHRPGTITLTYRRKEYTSTFTVDLEFVRSTPRGISISPAYYTLGTGDTFQYDAIIAYTNSTSPTGVAQAVWSSDNEAVATVSNSAQGRGTVTAISPGTAVITADNGRYQASMTITVWDNAQLERIEITPQPAYVVARHSSPFQFYATAYYADDKYRDITELAAWTTGDSSIARPYNVRGSRGKVYAGDVGVTTLTASYSGMDGQVELESRPLALESITLSPVGYYGSVGSQRSFTALGHYNNHNSKEITSSVHWSVDNTDIATVSDRGVVSFVSTGTTTIRAELDGIEGEVDVIVDDAYLKSFRLKADRHTPLELALDEDAHMKAIGTFSDGSERDITERVIWPESSDYVIMSNLPGEKGHIVPVRPVTYGSALRVEDRSTYLWQSFSLQVKNRTIDHLQIYQPDGKTEIASGETINFNVSVYYSDRWSKEICGSRYQFISLESSNPEVAEVVNSYQVTGVSRGTATITAKYCGHYISYDISVDEGTAVQTLVVNPAEIQGMHAGTTEQLKAIAYLADGTIADVTDSVNWYSNSLYVPVNAGLVSPNNNGSATITANYCGKQVTATVTVDSTAENTTKRFVVPEFTSDKAASLMLSYMPEDRTPENVTKATLSVNSSHTPVRDVMPEEGSMSNESLGGQALRPVNGLTAPYLTDEEIAELAKGGTSPEYYEDTPYTGYTDLSVGQVCQVYHRDGSTLVPMRKIYVGDSTMVFFEENGTGSLVSGYTESEAAAMAEKIDRYFGTANPYDPEQKSIRARVNGVFGTEWKTNPAGGMDGTDKLLIFLQSSTTLGSQDIMGYFYNADEFPHSLVSFSNQGEIIYLNCEMLKEDDAELAATFAHEYQHMCCWNQKYGRDGNFGGANESLTINEAWSSLAEQMAGLGFSDTYPLATLRVLQYQMAPQFFSVTGDFNTQSQQTIDIGGTEISASNETYGMAQALGNYIKDRFGLSVLRDIASSDGTGWENIEAQTNTSFNDIFLGFGKANMSSNREGASFSYSDFSLGKDKYYLTPDGDYYDGRFFIGTAIWNAETFISGRKRLEWSWSASDNAVESREMLPYSHSYYNYAGDGTDLDVSVTYPAGTGSAVLQLEKADGTYITDF
ncbi:MAG: Ig-like domain-containing protein [bacterium]|nr:Ig-like domain-containing protein [bacterium]